MHLFIFDENQPWYASRDDLLHYVGQFVVSWYTSKFTLDLVYIRVKPGLG